MTLAHDLNLPPSRLGIVATDNHHRANELYEAIRAGAPAGMRVGALAAPTPPISGTAPRRRRMRAERNTARGDSRNNQPGLPESVVRTLLVYLLSLPIFCFAATDLVLFFDQGRSSLGPALDAILMVFGGGFVIISLVATVTGTKRQNRPVSR